MSMIATKEVRIYTYDGETTIPTSLWQLTQWKHALNLEIKGLYMSREKVSTHLRRRLKAPRSYSKAKLLEFVTDCITDIEQQLGIEREENV